MRSLTAKWFFKMAGIPPAAFVFDDNLATELENLRKSKCRAVDESGECCTCIRQYFLRIGPATLVGEVLGLVEVLVLVDFAWMAFQCQNR